MIRLLKNIFGFSNKVNYGELVKNGAQIIDVRTPGEFYKGHIKGAVNIPLQELSDNYSKLKKDKAIITCCVSGMRSASAKSILKAKGFIEVYNGGGWIGLNTKIH